MIVGDVRHHAPSDGELLKSDALLRKASEIEQKQKEKVARAAMKLEKEEAQEKAVRNLSPLSAQASFTDEKEPEIILLRLRLKRRLPNCGERPRPVHTR